MRVLPLFLLVVVTGCSAQGTGDLIATAKSPNGDYTALLFKTTDPAGVLGEDDYSVFIEKSRPGEIHPDRAEVFSGANAHKTALFWRDDASLFVEFCEGRGIRSMSRYPGYDRAPPAPSWVTVQDVRASGVRVGNRTLCSKDQGVSGR